MRRWTEGFRELETAGETWFAGANTERGFVGCYADMANEWELERLYIVKGGPGTGKSTLIREAAEAAERAGFPVTRYLCGSDPGSLDGAVFDGRIAVVAGTAPHTLDMDFPGAASELFDCSRFWDGGMLEARREEIVFHGEAKREAYRGAYRYLAAAGKLLAEEETLAAECFDFDKAARAVQRLAKKIRPGTGKEGEKRTLRRFTHAVTMRGNCFVPTLTAGAESVYAVEDAMGTAPLFLNLLEGVLAEEGIPHLAGMFPIGGRIFGIRAGSAAFRYGEAREGEIPVRMTRFLTGDASLRGRLRRAEKIAGSALDGAVSRLSGAAEHHFALEEIYRSAMDYDRLAEYRRAASGEIVSRLGKPAAGKRRGR